MSVQTHDLHLPGCNDHFRCLPCLLFGSLAQDKQLLLHWVANQSQLPLRQNVRCSFTGKQLTVNEWENVSHTHISDHYHRQHLLRSWCYFYLLMSCLHTLLESPSQLCESNKHWLQLYITIVMHGSTHELDRCGLLTQVQKVYHVIFCHVSHFCRRLNVDLSVYVLQVTSHLLYTVSWKHKFKQR
jgi:hypothetical protein